MHHIPPNHELVKVSPCKCLIAPVLPQSKTTSTDYGVSSANDLRESDGFAVHVRRCMAGSVEGVAAENAVALSAVSFSACHSSLVCLD